MFSVISLPEHDLSVPPSRDRKRLRFFGSPDSQDSGDQLKSLSSGAHHLSVQGIGAKADQQLVQGKSSITKL